MKKFLLLMALAGFLGAAVTGCNNSGSTTDTMSTNSMPASTNMMPASTNH